MAWRIWAAIFILGLSDAFALTHETGSLRGLVLGDCPACAYDNWSSHITEGVVGSGYNHYGPSWFDPQTNGFGQFTLIPAGAAGDLMLDAWRAVFVAAVNGQWNSVDSLLAVHDSVWRYDLVELQDPELNNTFYILRERLDSSFVDTNVDSIPGDDVVGGFRNGWGLFVFNTAPLFPKLEIEMPHPEDDFMSIPVGLELFIRTGARVMTIAGAGREVLWDTTHADYNNGLSLSDPSRNCRHPFAVCHEVLYDLLHAGPTSPLVTIQQHSYDHPTHLGLPDVQLSAFVDDPRPNPPLRDRAEHRDLIHYLGMFPVAGLPGYPEITARVDQHVGLWSGPAYAFYSAEDTIPIVSTADLVGAGSNCEAVYSHRSRNIYVDPENFVHSELDEYPDQLWSPIRWEDWLAGPLPATLETYQLALAYYESYIAALDSSLRDTYLESDTTPPLPVELTQVAPFTPDSVYLRWSPPAADRFFDTYVVYFDTVDITDSSASVTRLAAGYAALRDFATTSTAVRIPAPPVDRCRFAVGSRDIWGNVAMRSASAGMSPGPHVLTVDEQISDSIDGNGSGLADYGETIGISLLEHNVGDQEAAAVTVRISTADPYVTITDSVEFYGTIPARSELLIPNAFQAILAADVADSHAIPISVFVTDTALGEWPNTFTLLAHAGVPRVGDVLVNDSAGNNNGIMNPGETVNLQVMLRNAGSARMDSLTVILASDHAGVTVVQGSATVNSLAPGATARITSFAVSVAASAPIEDRVVFYLELSMARGRTAQLLFELPVGGFSDRIEGGQGAWTHQPNQTGWNDQWHISTESAYSPAHAWKCGDTGTGTYASHMDAVLVTPVLNLTGREELRFWHWMQAEISGASPDSAYDGGIIEISVDGSPWQQVIPAGGYNKFIRCTAGGGNPYTGPFGCRTPCFSGTIPWTEVVCDLTEYSGQAQIRFRFGSDNGTGREGWYVDNVRIVRANSGSAPQNLQAAILGSAAHLTWNSPATAAAAGSLLGYNIYRDSVRIDSRVAALSYDDNLPALPYGNYLYAVTAQYSDSESVFSNAVSVPWDSIPGLVTDLVLRWDGQNFLLDWTLTDARCYQVYASFNAGSFDNALMTEVAGPPFILSGDISTFVRRFYLVRAVR